MSESEKYFYNLLDRTRFDAVEITMAENLLVEVQYILPNPWQFRLVDWRTTGLHPKPFMISASLKPKYHDSII